MSICDEIRSSLETDFAPNMYKLMAVNPNNLLKGLEVEPDETPCYG